MSARRIAVVTGSRAEFGLLEPVIVELKRRTDLATSVIAGGTHLLPPRTIDVVRRRVGVDAEFEMQREGRTGREADARALARGVDGLAGIFEQMKPDWVLVLGDRIEALAAACAASVGGKGLAQIHAGDRAEGIADEAIRHAITRLAHLHFAATEQSAARLRRMGEGDHRVISSGSPAAIGASEVKARPPVVNGREFEADSIFLMHPCDRDREQERTDATAILETLGDRRVLALAPNHDSGREGIMDAIEDARAHSTLVRSDHLEHTEFRAALKWLGQRGGVLVGNSSAGIIDAALLGCPAVDVGDRQAGREKPENVVHVERPDGDALREALDRARRLDVSALDHPYGAGRAHLVIADALGRIDPALPRVNRKRNTY